DLFEEVLFKNTGNVDGRSVYEDAPAPLLTPVHKVRLVTAHDELQIKLDGLCPPHDVVEFGWWIADHPKQRCQAIDRVVQPYVSFAGRGWREITVVIGSSKPSVAQRITPVR